MLSNLASIAEEPPRLLRFACPSGSRSVASTSWLSKSCANECRAELARAMPSARSAGFAIPPRIEYKDFQSETTFRIVNPDTPSAAEIAALRLPFGLPFGREHFVVIQILCKRVQSRARSSYAECRRDCCASLALRAPVRSRALRGCATQQFMQLCAIIFFIDSI